jgi:phosphatidylinositol alpha-1,6-mannosyltransferase
MELLFTGEFPPMTGGVATFMLSRALSASPERLRVLAPIAPGFDAWDAACGLCVSRYHYPFGTGPLTRARQLGAAFSALRSMKKKERFSLVTAGTALPFGWAAAILKSSWERLAIFCHSGDFLRPMDSYAASRLFRFTARKTDLFIANSGLTKSILVDLGIVPDRIAAIRPSIDPERFHPGISGEPFRTLWTEGGRYGPIILTVARLDGIHKGIDVMIQALRDILPHFPLLRYVVVGPGDPEKNYAPIARSLQVERHVVFHGRVEDRALPNCYAAADLFVLLSRRLSDCYEGFGIVYLEAMACGLPTVISSEAGAAEIVQQGENGLVVNPRQRDEIVQAILRILENPALARAMGAKAVAAGAAAPDWSPLDQLR